MERAIGSTFTHGGKKYRVQQGNGCGECAFRKTECGEIANVRGACYRHNRHDGINVVFVEDRGITADDIRIVLQIGDKEIDITGSGEEISGNIKITWGKR